MYDLKFNYFDRGRPRRILFLGSLSIECIHIYEQYNNKKIIILITYVFYIIYLESGQFRYRNVVILYYILSFILYAI